MNQQEFFLNKIKSSPFVVEEKIQQGEEMSLLHPQSINSVRVATMRVNGCVHILAATLRIGCGNAVTDNAGTGGIYASINIETGKLDTTALNYIGESYDYHPDTNVKIMGFQIPYWKDALNLIDRISASVSGATLVAWDIAYSDKGWILVEANDNGAWIILQSNRKIGLKPLLYSLMDKYFEC